MRPVPVAEPVRKARGREYADQAGQSPVPAHKASKAVLLPRLQGLRSGSQEKAEGAWGGCLVCSRGNQDPEGLRDLPCRAGMEPGLNSRRSKPLPSRLLHSGPKGAAGWRRPGSSSCCCRCLRNLSSRPWPSPDSWPGPATAGPMSPGHLRRPRSSNRQTLPSTCCLQGP